LSLLTLLRESIWGYPIIGAVHVLAVVWFGGTVLVSEWSAELSAIRRIGLALILVSGFMLFLLHPSQYANSYSFRLKMALLILLTRTKTASPVSLILWIAVIFAARGIAFL
jgi:hypothetical protein